MSSIRGAINENNIKILETLYNKEHIMNYLIISVYIVIIAAVLFTAFAVFNNIEKTEYILTIIKEDLIKEPFNKIKGYLWRKRLEMPIKKPTKVKQSPFPSPMTLPMTQMDAKQAATKYRLRKESVSYEPLNVNDEFRITLYAVLEEMPNIKV